MKLRIARSTLLLLTGIAAVALNHLLSGYAALFGISLSIAALLTVAYLFINLDKEIKPYTIIELVADAFSGIVIFTYPQSGEMFFTIVFSFWLLIQGALYLGNGVADLKNKESFAVYTLSGIIFIVFSFIIINYTSEDFNSVNYLIGFVLVLYSILNLFILMKQRKKA